MSARTTTTQDVALVPIAVGEVRRCPVCDARMIALPRLAVSIGGREPCNQCVRELLGNELAAQLLAAAS